MATATSSLASSAGLGGVGEVTPTPGTEASNAADTDIGSVLSAAYDSAVAGGTPGGEEGFPETIPTETPAETPIGESPTGQQPAPQSQGAEPYPLSPDGKAYMVPKDVIPALQNAQKFAETVQQWFGTPEEANAAYLQASDLRTMQNDWAYGTDPAIQGVMAHFSGMNHQDPAIRARFQQSFVKMAQMMPSFLKQSNPQAYSQFVGAPARWDATGQNLLSPASGLLTSAVEAAYERAAQSGNPADFETAKNLDYAVTGTYKTELPKYDPQTQARNDFEARERAFNQRQEAALSRDVQAFNQSSIEGSKFQDLFAAIDKTLAPIKGRYSEVAYQDLRNGIQREIVDTLKANPEFWLEHEQTFHQLIEDFKHTWRNGNPGAGMDPRIAAYKSEFLRQAQRLLPSIAQKRIGAATQRQRAQNGQFAAPKAAPQAPPAQPPQGQNGNGQRRLTSDEWDSQLREAMTVR